MLSKVYGVCVISCEVSALIARSYVHPAAVRELLHASGSAGTSPPSVTETFVLLSPGTSLESRTKTMERTQDMALKTVIASAKLE